jgi:hypothetical protein
MLVYTHMNLYMGFNLIKFKLDFFHIPMFRIFVYLFEIREYLNIQYFQ